MTRYVMNDVVQVQKEVTYGTDPGSWLATHSVLCGSVQCKPINTNRTSRNILRPYFGSAGSIITSVWKTISFEVEFQNGGTAGTVAAWDALLQGCNFAAGSLLTTPSRVEHALNSAASQASLTIRYFDDGVLHLLLGAKGTFDVSQVPGEVPKFTFTFTGLDGDDTATANPSTDYTGYKAPLAVTDTNTGAVTLGCTYATGALSGGTEYVSGGLNYSLGNQVKFVDLLGTATLPGQKVEITGRAATGNLMLELTAANVATFMDSVRANTAQSIGVVHGTTAGFKMLTFLPAAQILEPSLDSKDGRRLYTFPLDLQTSSTSGLDEVKLVAL